MSQPPLFFIHGMWSRPRVWDGLRARLEAAGHATHAPALPYHDVEPGMPPAPQLGEIGIGDYVAFLIDQVRQLSVPPVIVGHSMGGMLAARYALQHPGAVERLVLVNPIGLEDWKAEGVPWRDAGDWYAGELKTTFDSIRSYQLDVYYHGKWKPEYTPWVEMLAGMYSGPGRERVAWNQALASDMVFNQPVVHEFGDIQVPTTLVIGQKDRTAIGRDRAPDALKAKLGDYPALGRRAAAAIPGAALVEFDDLGHSPQVEAPGRFNAALLEVLSGEETPGG